MITFYEHPSGTQKLYMESERTDWWNGPPSPPKRPLVDYSSDEEVEAPSSPRELPAEEWTITEPTPMTESRISSDSWTLIEPEQEKGEGEAFAAPTQSEKSPVDEPETTSPNENTKKSGGSSGEQALKLVLAKLHASPSTRNEPTVASSKTAPVIAAKPSSPSAAALARIEAAKEEFNRSFPYGYTIINTSTEGLLCGFFAVIHSMRAQHPRLPCPTTQELAELFGAQAEEYATIFGMDNSNNFSVDQIAATLYKWGTAHNLNLRVGYQEEGKAPLLVSHPNEDEDTLMVWLHNDGNWNWNGTGQGLGHFSGMRPIPAMQLKTWVDACFGGDNEAEENVAEIRLDTPDEEMVDAEEFPLNYGIKLPTKEAQRKDAWEEFFGKEDADGDEDGGQSGPTVEDV